MVFWAGGMVNIMQDSPSDPVMMFTNSNVKDGLFTYKGSARKDRPSVALVTPTNNKEDGYKQNIRVRRRSGTQCAVMVSVKQKS